MKYPTILSYPTLPFWTWLDGRSWIWLWKWRFWYFVTLKKRLRTIDSDRAFSETVQHNMKSLRQLNRRMNHLIKPLAAMESVTRDARILVIGPRNEWDLLLLAKEGFYNTVGIDLISYSPCILLGDMHALGQHFMQDSFDVVLCGWTISYSANPQLVAEQILGVVKTGGLIGIGVEYAIDDPALDEAWRRQDGYTIQERDKLTKRVNSVEDILGLFDNLVTDVFWRHDAPLKRAHLPGKMIANPSAVCVLFSVKKGSTAHESVKERIAAPT